MEKENEKKLTGYPSIDKPWLKFNTQDQIKETIPSCCIYDYLWRENKDYLNDIALIYQNKEITYAQLFDNIDWAASAFLEIGITEGDIVPILSVTIPETIYSIYALNRIGAVANMIDPRTSVQGLQNYFLEVDAKVVVGIDAVCEKIIRAIENTTVEQLIIMSLIKSLPSPYELCDNNDKKHNMVTTWDDFLLHGKGERLLIQHLV